MNPLYRARKTKEKPNEIFAFCLLLGYANAVLVLTRLQNKKTGLLTTFGVIHLQDLANISSMLAKFNSFDQ